MSDIHYCCVAFCLQSRYKPSWGFSERESADLQVICSMEGVGVSLLNDKPLEVLYCTIHRYPDWYSEQDYWRLQGMGGLLREITGKDY